jgi:UDP-N-acetylglucosamine 1-carboxyvinyltransferase
MPRYVIEGNRPLQGRIRPCGNKNAALPCLAAALLTSEPVRLRNIPSLEDVAVMIQILEALGATVRRPGPHEVEIIATDIRTSELPAELARRIRASILFAGPLVARTGRAVFPFPGGDVIGRRRLDTHVLALREYGASVELDGAFRVQAVRLVGKDIFLDEASVTATENAIMAGVLAQGETVLRNAASEPHVQDLCELLRGMGAQIEGVGSNILRIRGCKSLHGAEYTIGPDYMEVGSFIGLAAATRGEVEIVGAAPDQQRMTAIQFAKLGIRWEVDGDTILVPRNQDLRVNPDLGGLVPRIDDAPWPGFPPDLTSIALVVATQVDGTILVHEKMFDARMFFVDKLIDMGARIILCDPHRAVIAGPSRLRGAELVSPDIRAGMAMVIAALCAEGRSTINNVYQIERGYEDITCRLAAIGARIERQD